MRKRTKLFNRDLKRRSSLERQCRTMQHEQACWSLNFPVRLQRVIMGGEEKGLHLAAVADAVRTSHCAYSQSAEQ